MPAARLIVRGAGRQLVLRDYSFGIPAGPILQHLGFQTGDVCSLYKEGFDVEMVAWEAGHPTYPEVPGQDVARALGLIRREIEANPDADGHQWAERISDVIVWLKSGNQRPEWLNAHDLPLMQARAAAFNASVLASWEASRSGGPK